MWSWTRVCPPYAAASFSARKHLRPIDEFGTRQIHGKRHSDLREARIHDVFAMGRALEPALGDFRGCHRARRDVLSNDEIAAIPGTLDAHCRRAAVVTPVVESTVDRHVL